MGTDMCRRKSGLGGSSVEGGHSYKQMGGGALGDAPRLSCTNGRQIHERNLPL